MSTSLLGKLPNDFICFDNLLKRAGTDILDIVHIYFLVSDQLSNMLVNCFTAVYLNSYLKK